MSLLGWKKHLSKYESNKTASFSKRTVGVNKNTLFPNPDEGGGTPCCSSREATQDIKNSG